MSEPHKKSIWPWIASVLVFLPVLYLVSYGVYFKWGGISWPERPGWVQNVGQRLFWPLTESARKSPTFRRAMNWYMSYWAYGEIDWEYGSPDDF